MNGQNNSGLVVLGFKIGETFPCRGVRHHVSIFDLGNGLTANPDDFRQMRLLHAGLPTKRPKSLGSFGFFPWPGVHFFRPCLAIVSQNRFRAAGRGPAGPFSDPWRLFDIDQRDVPHAALDAAVICSVQPATLRSLFLIDFLLLADAADCAAKPDANIERHWL